MFNKSFKNEYKLPGGSIENNELPIDAFKREVLEEIGCIINDIKELGITLEYKTKENFQQLSYIYVGSIVNDNRKILEYYLNDKY